MQIVARGGSVRVAIRVTLQRPGEANPVVWEFGDSQEHLAEWWIRTSIGDFVGAIPKAEEYGGSTGGSADLRLIGDNLAELMTWPEGVTSALRQELGCWFYMQGKVARLVSDYQQRRPGKADTWLDATVYSMMARRIQQAGRWP